MCTPMLGFVISAAQAVASFAAQSADYAAKSAQWKQNYTNALAAGREEQKQLITRVEQEQGATALKDHLSLVEEAEARSTAQVIGASNGIAGISLGNIIGDITRKAATNRAINDENYRWTAAQLTQELEATNTTIENRINSVQRPVAPSPLGMVLNIAGAGFKSFASM